MKKTLLIAVALACVTLLASVAEAVPQKSSAAAHKRRASHQKSQPQSIALDRPPLDESAVKWSCEHNKAFWLSGDFKSDPSLTCIGLEEITSCRACQRRPAPSAFRIQTAAWIWSCCPSRQCFSSIMARAPACSMNAKQWKWQRRMLSLSLCRFFFQQIQKSLIRRRLHMRRSPRLKLLPQRANEPAKVPTMTHHNLYHTLQIFDHGSGKGLLYSLPRLTAALGVDIARLPVSMRLLLESVLRNYDGARITETHIQKLARWQPVAARSDEIPFGVARIVLQDFTGVPLLADLAAMRGVAERMGHNPKSIEPLVPVDLVVDHSVQVDYFRRPDALDLNMKLEFQRNRERYQFMKWGMQAFDTFRVVPPGVGIVHQVNLEYLARGLHKKKVNSSAPADNIYYPDTLVGTDSHTTMING